MFFKDTVGKEREMDSYVGKAIFNTRLTDCQISKNTLSLYLDGDTAKNMLWQKSDDGTMSFCHKPLSRLSLFN